MEIKVGPLIHISFMLFQIILSSKLFVLSTSEETERKVVCSYGAELGLVIDSSVSISQTDFYKGLNFLTNLLSSYGIGPGYSQFRVSAVTYGDQVYESDWFSLDEFSTKEEVLNAIMNMQYRAGFWTNTGEAIQFMREKIMEKARALPVRKIIIVLTDGNSQDGEYTANQAETSRLQGFTIFSVGVGNMVSDDELINITGSSDRMFKSESYDSLRDIQDALAQKVCGICVWNDVPNHKDCNSSMTYCNNGVKVKKILFCDNDNDCPDKSDELYCGPPSITMDDGKIYFARVDEPFTVQFQVESYYSSKISSFSVVGKDGKERILHEIGEWTQNLTPNVSYIKLSEINLTIANVTTNITNSKFFMTVRNEMGSDDASFMLAQKGKPCERSANQRVRDAYINTKLKTLKIEFQFECHPVPKISGIHIQDNSGGMVLPKSQWHQIITENTPQPFITTIALSIQYTSNDFFLYQYVVNFTNSEGTTTLDFGVSSQEVTEKGENSPMTALITASTVALIVVTVGVVIWKKMGGSLYSKLKINKRIDISSYSGLDANGRFFNSAQEELEEVYDEIVECSDIPEVGNEPVKADHACMLIPNHNDVLSPLPTCCSLDDQYLDLQKEPSGKNSIGDNNPASSQPEQSDYIHCLHDSFETASVESGSSQYLYPVYTESIVSNSASLAVAQDSDYESPKYLQHIFVFKTASRTEQPRTELDEKDQQTDVA